MRERLLLLHRIPIMTRRMLYKLLKKDKKLQTPFQLSPSELSTRLTISIEKATQLYAAIHDKKLREKVKRDASICKTVTIFDSIYPKQLFSIYEPPLVLYAQGDLSLLKSKKLIATIGTRNPSAEAHFKVTHFVTPLVKENWTIVSGLAYGIDSLAHELTLRLSGKTIAIIGSGFYHIYPQRHLSLYREIAKKGLVLSEYPPNTPPKKYHFPERNRIISGISRAILVIEAAEKSGTFITVDHALEQGKDIYVVPGSLRHEQTIGCHRLIQQGAKLVIDTNDILEDFSHYLYD